MTQTLSVGAELTTSQFSWISGVVKDLCGINLHDGKMALVRARLSKRLRLLGLRSFGEYVDYVKGDAGGAETVAMLDALSTNLTHFFRESRHFEILTRRVVPAMVARHRHDRRLRIWSAGCSSGEEPYSVAITLRETIPDLDAWDAGILATDLSPRMLLRAREGVYNRERLRETPAQIMHRHFRRDRRRAPNTYQVKPSVQSLVHFAHLNLMDAWPMRGLFDVIFCRNVMIYFDKPTQARLIERLWDQLVPGGTLFIGHSESLAGVPHRFRYVEPTIYEKPASQTR